MSLVFFSELNLITCCFEYFRKEAFSLEMFYFI